MSGVARLRAVALVALAAGCAPVYWTDWRSPIGRTHPLAGKILDVRAGAFI